MNMPTRLQSWMTMANRLDARAMEMDAVIAAEQQELVENTEDLDAAIEARDLSQGVAEAVQQSASSQLAGVVTRCLGAVFDDPYEFEIKFVQKRGKTEALLQFVRDGHPIDPLGAAGGGVVDVAAFALRLACLALSTPQRRRVVVMDEPFRFVSTQYRPQLRGMLTALSEDMGFQFIFVTHIPELAVGHVVEIN